jgi:hypothetical protein
MTIDLPVALINNSVQSPVITIDVVLPTKLLKHKA